MRAHRMLTSNGCEHLIPREPLWAQANPRCTSAGFIFAFDPPLLHLQCPHRAQPLREWAKHKVEAESAGVRN